MALHFSLPGLISLLALINPASSALWRVSFAIAAIGGVVVLIAVRGPALGKLGLTAYLLAIALYALIAIVAIAPGIVGGLGVDAAPVRVEAVLLTILVFTGVNVAWLLLFEPAPPGRALPEQGAQAHQASLPHHSGTSQRKPAGESGPGAPSPT